MSATPFRIRRLLIGTVILIALAGPAAAPFSFAQSARPSGQAPVPPGSSASQMQATPSQPPQSQMPSRPQSWSAEQAPRHWGPPPGRPPGWYGPPYYPYGPSYYDPWGPPRPFWVPGQWVWNGWTWFWQPGYWRY